MRSLRWKLGGALLLIVATSVGLMAYITNINTSREFNQYLSTGDQIYVQDTGAKLERFYTQQGNWARIQIFLPDLLRSMSERLIVTDASGVIVGDTVNQWLGKTAGSAGLSNGLPIYVSNKMVGELYLITTHPGSGNGYMGGGKGRFQATSSVITATTEEQDFLGRVNRSLVFTGLIAAAVALLTGLVLTRQITRPVKNLTDGARQIARGNLGYRVNIKAADELGDLGRSFNAMASSLDEAEQERRRIIADITHELRTPLTIIEGTVTGIQDGVFKPDNDHLEAIKEQTMLLARLTSDLRDLSLAESGQLKLELIPVNLAELVRRKVLQFETQAHQKGVRLTLDLPGKMPELSIDRGRIEQVVSNLITNAIRHTPSGGSVSVSVRQSQRSFGHQVDKPGLVLSVADTGEGITKENLPHVFDRFYRVEKSRARSEGGSGLGLAIVQQMVLAHGGRVWAESEPGKGSIFLVALPLA